MPGAGPVVGARLDGATGRPVVEQAGAQYAAGVEVLVQVVSPAGRDAEVESASVPVFAEEVVLVGGAGRGRGGRSGRRAPSGCSAHSTTNCADAALRPGVPARRSGGRRRGRTPRSGRSTPHLHAPRSATSAAMTPTGAARGTRRGPHAMPRARAPVGRRRRSERPVGHSGLAGTSMASRSISRGPSKAGGRRRGGVGHVRLRLGLRRASCSRPAAAARPATAATRSSAPSRPVAAVALAVARGELLEVVRAPWSRTCCRRSSCRGSADHAARGVPTARSATPESSTTLPITRFSRRLPEQRVRDRASRRRRRARRAPPRRACRLARARREVAGVLLGERDEADAGAVVVVDQVALDRVATPPATRMPLPWASRATSMAGRVGLVVVVHEVADDRRLAPGVAQLVAAAVGDDAGPVVPERRVDDVEVAAGVGARVAEAVVLGDHVVDHRVAGVALADVDAGVGAARRVGCARSGR